MARVIRTRSQDLPDVHADAVGQVLAGLPAAVVPDLHVGVEGAHQQLHHLHVVLHGCHVQRRVPGAGADVHAQGNVALPSEADEQRQELSLASLGGPVEAGEASDEILPQNEAGLSAQQALETGPPAVRSAEHPLVFQRIQGSGGSLVVQRRGVVFAAERQAAPHLRRAAHHQLQEVTTAAPRRDASLAGGPAQSIVVHFVWLFPLLLQEPRSHA